MSKHRYQVSLNISTIPSTFLPPAQIFPDSDIHRLHSYIRPILLPLISDVEWGPQHTCTKHSMHHMRTSLAWCILHQHTQPQIIHNHSSFPKFLTMPILTLYLPSVYCISWTERMHLRGMEPLDIGINMEMPMTPTEPTMTSIPWWFLISHIPKKEKPNTQIFNFLFS